MPSVRPHLFRLLAVPAASVLVLLPVSSASADVSGPAMPGLAIPTALPTALPTELTELADPVQSLLSSLSGAAASSGSASSGQASSGQGGFAGSVAGGSSASGSGRAGSVGGSALTGTSTPSVSAGGGLDGAGYGCLSAGPKNGGGVVVLGQDLLGQIADALPQVDQFVVPCTTRNGAAVDADLVAATLCLRLDPTSPTPLRATVKLLGQDVLQQLEAAGLPLDTVVVPCLSRTSSTRSTTRTADQAAAAVKGTKFSAAPAASSADRLPFTGGNLLFPAVLGACLLGAGAMLVRRARHDVLSGAHR